MSGIGGLVPVARRGDEIAAYADSPQALQSCCKWDKVCAHNCTIGTRSFCRQSAQRPWATLGTSSTTVVAAAALRVKAMAAAASQSVQRGFMAMLGSGLV